MNLTSTRIGVEKTLLGIALSLMFMQPHTLLATELDDLSPTQLQAALDAELGDDDLRQFGVDPRKAYPLELLHEVIMQALSDEGDDDDEQLITLADLEEEMDEAGTNLSQVVWDALTEADRIAGLPSHGSALRKVAQRLAREDGLTPSGTAATQAKLSVRRTVQRVK